MRALILALTLVVASSASAQTKAVNLGSPNPPQAPAIDPAHKATPEQLREYFAIIHLGDTLKASMSQVLAAMKTTSAPYIPDSMWKDMDATMNGYDFLSELIPIYQKHLTREDMDGVLTFYRTDAGKHLLANQGPMGAEVQAAFGAIGRRLGEQVGMRHAEEIEAAKKKYEDGIAGKQMINLNPDPK